MHNYRDLRLSNCSFRKHDRRGSRTVVRSVKNRFEITRKYSYTNPPYITEEAAIYLRNKNVEHLLIDLPSIDRERDNGELKAHHAFWNTSGKLRMNATITEMIFVPNNVVDGTYLLNIQIAPFENDASPSKPVLYKTIE